LRVADLTIRNQSPESRVVAQARASKGAPPEAAGLFE
jgi:hypothetical protein